MTRLSLRLSRGPASSSFVHVCFHSLCVGCVWGRAREAKKAWACFTVRWSGSMYVMFSWAWWRICDQSVGGDHRKTTEMTLLTLSITRSINYIGVWSFERFPTVKLSQNNKKVKHCPAGCDAFAAVISNTFLTQDTSTEPNRNIHNK